MPETKRQSFSDRMKTKRLKTEIKTSGRKWNSFLENEVKKIGEQTKGYKIIHIKNARITRRYHDFLMYMGIILGPLSAFILGIKEARSPDDISPEIILSICVSFISGMVIATTKYAKYEAVSSAHKLAASKYSSLESNIRRQLLKNRSDRVDSSRYLEYIGESFDELFKSSPLVAEKIYNEYVEMAKSKGISVPDEYGFTINIEENYETKKNQEISDVTAITINDTPNTVENNKKIKRTNSFSLMADFGKYNDGKMNYELSRLMGFR